MCGANERQCYNVTSSLIGLAHSMASGAAQYEKGHWLHRNLSNEKSSLHWCHMIIMASWFTGNLTVCSTVVHSDIKGNIIALDYWPFVKGIHWWPVDSLHKGPVMWKVFPCHDVIMTLTSSSSSSSPLSLSLSSWHFCFSVCSMVTTMAQYVSCLNLHEGHFVHNLVIYRMLSSG